MATASVFQDVDRAPPDVVFNVVGKYKEDTDVNKVNLSIGGKLQRSLQQKESPAKKPSKCD